MKKNILFLSMEDVIAAGATDMGKAVDDVRRGFCMLYSGKVLNPMKTTLKAITNTHEHHVGLVNTLSAYVEFEDDQIFSFKLLGAMPPNTCIGLPRASGLIVLFDGKTKTPMVVMDAQVISAIRTGAASSLAAEAFLPDDIDSVLLVGAGVNMKTQLLGISKARPGIKNVKVYSRGRTKFDFADSMSAKLGLNIEPVSDCEAAAKNQRFIVTCLPNIENPVVKSKWLIREGLTFFNIGCYEAETHLLARMDRIVADMWIQGKHRGVQTHAKAVEHGAIPEELIEDFAPIVSGERPGRLNDRENIFFNPTGLGFEDAMVAARVYRTAVQEGIGKELELWNDSEWI